MSSDNGIYIHRFKDGYRVIHGQAVENAFESKESMEEYFGKTRTFETEAQAMEYAMKLYKRIIKKGYDVEYGIQFI